jgi:hypothetical protein
VWLSPPNPTLTSTLIGVFSIAAITTPQGCSDPAGAADLGDPDVNAGDPGNIVIILFTLIYSNLFAFNIKNIKLIKSSAFLTRLQTHCYKRSCITINNTVSNSKEFAHELISELTAEVSP